MGRSKSVRKRMIINIITTIFIIVILCLVTINGVLLAKDNKRDNSNGDDTERQSWQIDGVETEAAEQVKKHEYETELKIDSNIKPKETEKESETETQVQVETQPEPEPQPEPQPQPQPETQPESQPETEPQPEPQPEPETQPEPQPQPETPPQPPTGTSNIVILADSNTRYIDPSELVGMSAQDLIIARNEIFARMGRGFKDSSLQAYFDDQIWYTQKYTPEEFNAIADSLFNVYEVANINTIVAYEKEMGYR